MALKDSLRNRPVIYEIVPPRRDPSRFQSELRGVEEVLNDPRISAVNVPELTKRREEKGQVDYSPVTIPPEEYALMIKEHKEPIVNVVAPRMERDEFLSRARRILRDYGIRNLVLVGKERREDALPGPGVMEALRILRGEKGDHEALGGICIFDRESRPTEGYGGRGQKMGEHRRVWLKGTAGCDFVTSQITFDARAALGFLTRYQRLCRRTNTEPLTVFISLTTVSSQGILSLLGDLDVTIPSKIRRRLLGGSDMGRESVRIASEVFGEVIEGVERDGVDVPLGLQIEQVGVNSDRLSLGVLDGTYQLLKQA